LARAASEPGIKVLEDGEDWREKREQPSGLVPGLKGHDLISDDGLCFRMGDLTEQDELVFEDGGIRAIEHGGWDLDKM
jgi:hypothetical protein